MAAPRLSDTEIRNRSYVRLPLKPSDSLRRMFRPNAEAMIKLGEAKGYQRVADVLRSSYMIVDDNFSNQLREAAISNDTVRIEQLLKGRRATEGNVIGTETAVRLEQSEDLQSHGLLAFLSSFVADLQGEHEDADVDAKIESVEAAIARMLSSGNVPDAGRSTFIAAQLMRLVEFAKHNPNSRNVFLRKAAQIAKEYDIDPDSLGVVIDPKQIKKHIRI